MAVDLKKFMAEDGANLFDALNVVEDHIGAHDVLVAVMQALNNEKATEALAEVIKQHDIEDYVVEVLGIGVGREDLIKFIGESIDDRDIEKAWEQVDKWHCPLDYADSSLYNRIQDLVEEFCLDNGLDADEYWDIDEIFREL